MKQYIRLFRDTILDNNTGGNTDSNTPIDNKFRKKPVVIDAFMMKRSNVSELKKFVESFGQSFEENFHFIDGGADGASLKVKTLEGTSYDVQPTDVIIRGVNGEYYPCKLDIFEKTYEPASTPSPSKPISEDIKEIAQYIISNRYPRSENDKVSDAEMFHALVEKISSREKELQEEMNRLIDVAYIREEEINELKNELRTHKEDSLMLRQTMVGRYEEIKKLTEENERLKGMLERASWLVGNPGTNISSSTDIACDNWQKEYQSLTTNK